ncbi:putative Na+/H+ antiporter [Horticoccus luteus]|uniref:Na+/H+ antiporter n=1 Tax=Horticoccus luteus TaxID=2862869 RepID=A0A8F9TYK6_9BACT|nr:putative Na+/H+ antiporter [Horticoccus luteus]QYM80525.1 putative Na+/H+ antiporter [Horticoccus luteus]
MFSPPTSRVLGLAGALLVSVSANAAEATAGAFPRPLDSYMDPAGNLWQVLVARVHAEPFNAVAALIFLLAIVHTFLAGRFRHWAHVVEERHAHRIIHAAPATKASLDEDGRPIEVSFWGQVLHFLGEVEAVFGIWGIVLMVAIGSMKGWTTAVDYVGHKVNFTEAMFVVVIMAMASTRPVLRCAEKCLQAVANLGKRTTGAWWLTILIIAPVLGSFITEPAAMTIGALLLAQRFYALQPSRRFCYATLGLLFVNVSVGGTMTHFAAPPVLMVAGPWGWDMPFMFLHFGWKALTGIVAATLLYYFIFRRELAVLEQRRAEAEAKAAAATAEVRIPGWITVVQLGFMALAVSVAHYPALFVAAFLFFLAFGQATAHHQNRLDLRAPLLVGFFLAGLVVHGGLQGWWISPVLSSLAELPLFIGATVLTAFNDNAAITYLATLVPDFTDALKYAVVAGAVTGGGLTVIANAPNPAGQNILQRYFPEGISPLGLLAGAVAPTAILGACFILL